MAFAWVSKRENSLNLWGPRMNITTGAFISACFHNSLVVNSMSNWRQAFSSEICQESQKYRVLKTYTATTILACEYICLSFARSSGSELMAGGCIRRLQPFVPLVWLRQIEARKEGGLLCQATLTTWEARVGWWVFKHWVPSFKSYLFFAM